MEVVNKIVVVGLGYVGLPLAVALARHFEVVGLDIDSGRIRELREGHDKTGEVEQDDLAASNLVMTDDPDQCAGADIYIVTVPTPIDDENCPDLSPVLAASATVAHLLDPARAPIIVYESTVYPGVTEEICGPLLARESGLIPGRDFFLGYSPERINPGDRTHRIDNIVKVVAGESAETLEKLASVYEKVTGAGVFRARSIKAAEAAKVIENAQRDINIAFMNEISQIFARLDLSIWDVLDAATTKWNFLPFRPGLVGGHCIGVDPFYLSFRAQQLGHEPQVILAGRKTNDDMGRLVADMVHEARHGRVGSVLILGLTFKEDVPDLRNSRVVDVIRRFESLGYEVGVHDPAADVAEAAREYGIKLDADAFDRQYDVVFGAVAHAAYRCLDPEAIASLLKPDGLLADLRGMWRGVDFGPDVRRWSL